MIVLFSYHLLRKQIEVIIEIINVKIVKSKLILYQFKDDFKNAGSSQFVEIFFVCLTIILLSFVRFL